MWIGFSVWFLMPWATYRNPRWNGPESEHGGSNAPITFQALSMPSTSGMSQLLPMKSISWYLSGNCGSLYLLHLESFAESKRRKNHWSKLTLFLSLSRFHLYFFIHQNSEVKIWIMFFQCLISMFAWPYITIMTHVSLLCTAQYQSMKNEIEMLKMVSLKLPKSRSSSYFHVGPTEPDPSEPTWQMLDMAKLSLGGNSVPLENGFKS